MASGLELEAGIATAANIVVLVEQSTASLPVIHAKIVPETTDFKDDVTDTRNSNVDNVDQGSHRAAKSQLQHLDHTHHAAIIEARSLGKSMKDIALIMHRSEHQIRRICKNHDKYGHLGPRRGSGRKRKTSAEEDDAILEEAARQRKNISGSTLHKLLGLKNISERTVRRRMKEQSAVQESNVDTFV